MKHYSAFILLLLMPVPLIAQMRVPALQRSTEANEDQKHFYEGRRIFSLEFRGNQHFTSETLLEVMKTQRGEAYYAEQLDDDKDRLRVLFLYRRGYLKARIGDPEIEDSINGLRIVLPILEGSLYRYGAVKIDGATYFSPEEALKIIGLESGEITDGRSFLEGLSKLETLYKDRGYAQFDIGFDPDFKEPSSDSLEGVVDMAIEIQEGQVFRIKTIRFQGDTGTNSRALRRQLLIHDGEIYNHSLLEGSLVSINSLGLFEEVLLHDLTIQADDDRSQVDITINLKQKGTRTEFARQLLEKSSVTTKAVRHK